MQPNLSPVLCAAGLLLSCTASQASFITIESGTYNFAGAQWDTRLTVPMDSAARYNGRTPITGSMTLFMNSTYAAGTRGNVGIDLSNGLINGQTFADYNYGSSGNEYVMTLYDATRQASVLSVNTMDYYLADNCSTFPDDPICLQFDSGNAGMTPFPGFGTVEAGYRLSLDLGFISLVNDGAGNALTLIDYNQYGIKPISLNLTALEPDLPDDTSFYYTSSPVPVPASIWLFLSGITALAGLHRRRHVRLKD